MYAYTVHTLFCFHKHQVLGGAYIFGSFGGFTMQISEVHPNFSNFELLIDQLLIRNYKVQGWIHDF